MKRSSLYTLTLLFTGLLVLFSCRKDIEYYLLDRDRPTSEVLENAKIWYLQSIDKENVRQRLKPHWKDAWTVSRGGRSPIVVVPANERRLRNRDRDISIRRFFVFTLRGEDVADGNIVEFVGEKYDVSKNLDFLLQAFGKEEVTGFNGSFITYDINYGYINSAVFKNGKKVNATTEIQTLDKSSVYQALQKHTVFGKPIKKLASTTPMAFGDEECDDVYPTWNGPPISGFGEDCVVNVTVTTVYDPFSGCAIS